jgi:hypothetical protein
MLEIDKNWVDAAVIGGGILGGGGGGSLEKGRRLGRLALELGSAKIFQLDQLPPDSLILTVSAVGAPSANQTATPVHFVRAVKLIMDRLHGRVGGLMTNELGGMAAINGLVQSAILGIPVIDAACNGRAYPIGTMGAMGLSMQDGFISRQAAVGGKDAEHVEIYAEGELAIISRLIIRASAEAGGLIAVARNPLPASYVKENAAVGALSQAVQLGQVYLRAQTAKERVKNVAEALDGEVIACGRVDSIDLSQRNGLDVGSILIKGLELSFWNEYMTLESKDRRLATFPDLIMTMDAETGRPVSSAEIKQGQEIFVFTVPKDELNLGAGMSDPNLFYDVEKVTGKEIVRYVFQKEL